MDGDDGLLTCRIVKRSNGQMEMTRLLRSIDETNDHQETVMDDGPYPSDHS